MSLGDRSPVGLKGMEDSFHTPEVYFLDGVLWCDGSGMLIHDLDVTMDGECQKQ